MTPADLARLDGQARARAVRGSLLFHLALAESLAGDALAARLAPETTGGWALDVTPDGYEVTAIGLGALPEVRARVTFAADGSPLVETTGGGAASPRQVALARAREAGAAYAAGLGGRWLSLPVPPPRDTPVGAGLETCLAPLADRPEDQAAAPHRRLAVSTDTGEVRELDPVGRPDRIAPGAEGRGPGELVLMHDGETPGEAHVMLSLRFGIALEVRTTRPRLRWRVDGEAVGRLAP